MEKKKVVYNILLLREREKKKIYISVTILVC